jgi:hypothetical protein
MGCFFLRRNYRHKARNAVLLGNGARKIFIDLLTPGSDIQLESNSGYVAFLT